MDVSIHFNDQPRLVTVKVTPTRPPPNTTMYISYDDVKFESSYLGEVPKAEGVALKFFFGDGLTWDDVFDRHDFVILPLSRLP